jgi:hypothetical protein
VALGLALGAASMQLLHAQQSIRRTILQKRDTVDIPGRKVVIGIAETRPNTAAGRHTQPAPNSAGKASGSTSGQQFSCGMAPIAVASGLRATSNSAGHARGLADPDLCFRIT